MPKFFIIFILLLSFIVNTKSQNIEGVYNSEYSTRMGNWMISESCELIIQKTKNNTMVYTVNRTVKDEYNNNIPSVSTFSGTIKKSKLANGGLMAWQFVGGDYGSVGAHFFSPDKKDNYIRVWIPKNGVLKEQSRDYIKQEAEEKKNNFSETNNEKRDYTTSKIELNEVINVIKNDNLYYEFSDFYYKNFPVTQSGNSWINFSENKKEISWFYSGKLFKGTLENPIANKIENKLELELNWKNKSSVGTQNAMIYIEFNLDRIESRWNTLIRLKILNSEMIAYLKLEKSKFEIVNNYINTNPEILYDNIYETHDSVRIVESEGKYGFINNSGQKLVEMEYDCISPFKKDLFLVGLNNKYGIIDNNGKLKVPINYNYIHDVDYYNLLEVRDDKNKIGFFDYHLGIEVIPCKYEDTYLPGNGLLQLQLGNKWGLYNCLGKEIIPINILDKFPDIPKYSIFDISDFNIVCNSCDSNKVTLYGKNGKIISRNQYDFVQIFEISPVNKDYESIEYPIVKKGDKYGLIDTNGNVLINPIFEDLFPFREGLAGFKIDGKYGFVDTKGNIVISPKYEKVESFREGLAGVQLNGKLGFIDKKEKAVIPFIYDTTKPVGYQDNYISNGIFFKGLTNVKRNKKWGIIDSVGHIVLPFIYDEITWEVMFSDSNNNKSNGICWQLKLKNKYGIYSPKNKLDEIKFDYIGHFFGSLAEFEMNGKKGFLNKKGLIIIPAKFDKVGSFSNGLASVVLNEKVGFINRQGKIVVPCIYDQTGQMGIEYYNFSNECSEVYLNNERFYINKKGRTISDCN